MVATKLSLLQANPVSSLLAAQEYPAHTEEHLEFSFTKRGHRKEKTDVDAERLMDIKDKKKRFDKCYVEVKRWKNE